MPSSFTEFTNEDTGLNHRGNPERDPLREPLDVPLKLASCLLALNQFRLSTIDGGHPSGYRLRDGRNNPLPQSNVINSSRFPTDAELLLAHTPSYLQSFKRKSDEAILKNEMLEFGIEAAVSPGTYKAALNAVGAALDMIDSVLTSSDKTGFANVWPPGHHAEPDLAMGFCYLSTAAIAAKYARNHHHQINRGQMNRIAVIDTDNHTGNGTRAVLANEPNILLADMDYQSSYDPIKKIYTDYTIDRVTGKKDNQGKEFPYRLPDKEMGTVAHPIVQALNIIEVRSGFTDGKALLESYIHNVLPRLKEFKPDVIIWDIGIDSLMGDEYGGMGHTVGSKYSMIRGTRLAIPDARVCGIMEGGYTRENHARCLPALALALHEDPSDSKNRSSLFKRYRSFFTVE